MKDLLDGAGNQHEHSEGAAAGRQRPVRQAARNAGGRCEPYGRGGGQSPDCVVAAASDDGTGSKKSDAGDDTLNDVRGGIGISTAGRVGRVDGGKNENSRAKAHHGHGSEAGGLSSKLPIQTDERSTGHRRAQTHEDVLISHRRILPSWRAEIPWAEMAAVPVLEA